MTMFITWGILSNRDEIYEYIINKKNQAERLNAIRKSSGISMYSVVKLGVVSIYTICKTKIVMSIQSYMDGLNIIQLDKNLFEISLFIKGKFVKMLVRLKRGPNIVMHAVDENGKDITDKLDSYYTYDLCMITPNVMKHESIELITCNGESIKYTGTDKIL